MSAVQPSSAQLAESLLAFWSEAGVDAMLQDAPVDRIAEGKIATPQPPPGRKAAPVAPVARTSTNQLDISAAVARMVSAERIRLVMTPAAEVPKSLV